MPTRAFAEIRAARHSQHSRNPCHAGPVFRGFTGSRLLRPVRLLAPLDGSDRVSPATGGFYIQASDGLVALPAAGYDYNSTGLLCWRDFHPQEWQLASLHQIRAGPIRALGSHLGCLTAKHAVRGPAPVTRLPGPEPGACGPGPRSPRPPPFAPPTPRTVARRCSPASPLLGRGLTSPVRASSATAPRLPDADQTARGPVVGREISRFPCPERACMPGSLTTPDRPGARAGALARVAFRFGNSVGIRNHGTVAAQWLACTVPCRRFAPGLAARHARLGADVDRYSFVVSDSHRLLLAGLPAHYQFTLIGTCHTRKGAAAPSGGVEGWPAMGSGHRDVVITSA